MADPLTITASIATVVIPALQGAKALLNDLERIKDAPKEVLGIKEDVSSIENALQSLQAVNPGDWASLGGNLAGQSRLLIAGIKNDCTSFKTDLALWTRHSPDRKLVWQDRISIGFWKQGRIKSLSEQLQARKLSIYGLVGIATLYRSIQNSHLNDTHEIQGRASVERASTTTALATARVRVDETRLALNDLALDDRARAAVADQRETEQQEETRSEIQERMDTLEASIDILM